MQKSMLTREYDGQKTLRILNLSALNTQTKIELNTINAKLLLSNYQDAPENNKIKSTITLRPFEAIIYQL